MQRLGLRFGNQRADTIPEHLSILDEVGAVWWGWWAKARDPVPTAAQWQEILEAMNAGDEIGLFDRRAVRFYIARCEELKIVDGTARIQSPGPTETPTYY